MLRPMLFAAMFLASNILAFAQPKVEWGQVTPLESDDEDVRSIRLDNGGYFSIEYAPAGISGKHVTARLFDENGKKVKESKFKFESQSKAFLFLKLRPQMERLIEVGGRYYFLLRELDVKNRTIKLQSWAFDPASLTVAKEPVTVAAVKQHDYQLASYHWTISAKEDHFYVLEFPGKGENPASELTLKAYNPELKLLYEKKFLLPSAIEFLKVNTFSLEHGHLVISSTEYEKRPPIWRKNMPNFKLLYFVLSEGEENMNPVVIDLPGVRAYQARHVFRGPDDFLVYGLYSKSKADLASGAFFARYDMKRKQLDTPQMRAFPGEIVEFADHRKKGFRDDNGDEVSNFKIYDVFFRPDGGLQFIAEQSNDYWLSFSYGNFDGSMETTVSGTKFEIDNIMLFTLYNDPSRDWFSLIKKRQSALGTDRDFSFSHTYDKDGTVWMFYNDLPENLALPPSKEPANLKSGRDKMGTVLAKIDSKGNVSKELLFTKKDLGHWFAPRQTVYMADGTVLLTALEKKSYRIGKFRLDQ